MLQKRVTVILDSVLGVGPVNFCVQSVIKIFVDINNVVQSPWNFMKLDRTQTSQNFSPYIPLCIWKLTPISKTNVKVFVKPNKSPK